MKKIYMIFLTILGAVLYRIRGGLAPAFPRPVDQFLFALPYGAISYKVSNRNSFWFFGVMALTVLAASTGHGQYMDLGNFNLAVKPETLDFIVSAFFGPDTFDSFWRDGFGLAVTGLVVTLPCALCLAYYRMWFLSAILALSGALKFPAYWVGWEVFGGTGAGEFLTGGLLWGVAILVYSALSNR